MGAEASTLSLDIQIVITCSLVFFGILAGVVYYLTSDAFRNRRMKQKLGHDVTTCGTLCKAIWHTCMGPIYREKWEHSHKFYRSEDYGQPDDNWQDILLAKRQKQEWLFLPRGDEPHHRHHTSKALARVMLQVEDLLIREAISTVAPQVSAERHRKTAALMEQRRQMTSDALRQKEASERQREAALQSQHAEQLASKMMADDEKSFEALWGAGAIAGLASSMVVKKAIDRSDGVPADEHGYGDGEVQYARLDFHKDNAASAGASGGTIGYADLDFGGGGAPKRPALANSALGAPPSRPAVPGGTVGYADLDFGDGDGGGRSSKSRASVAPQDAKGVVRRLDGYSRVLSLADLRRVDRGLMMEDFKSLPTNLPPPGTYPAHTSTKNRSGRVLPALQSHVHVDKEDDSRYINASYVRGPDGQPMRYIATQEPLSGLEPGKDRTVRDFWDTVWNHDVRVVVKLNPPARGAPPYYPTPDKQLLELNPMCVALAARREIADGALVVSRLRLECSGESKGVEHYALDGWATGALPHQTAIFKLAEILEKLMRKFIEPIVVHCDMGTERTGILLGLLHGRLQLKQRKAVDILGTVARLREDRAGAIGNFAHYEQLHQLLCAESVRDAPPPPAYGAPPPSFDEGEDDPMSPAPADLAAMELALNNETLNEAKINAALKSSGASAGFDSATAAFSGSAPAPAPAWPQAPPPPASALNSTYF